MKRLPLIAADNSDCLLKLAFSAFPFFAYFGHYIAKTFLILEHWNKHFSCTLVKFYAFKDVSQIILKNFNFITLTITLLKRDSNAGAFLWIFRNIYEHLFNRTPPLAASALNFTLYFQIVNSGCTIWIRELFTWIYISCSFICSFVFVIFSSQVRILTLIGSFSSN